MSLKIDRVQLEIIVQQDSARQQMMQLENQMRSAQKELAKIKKSFGENSDEYRAQEKVIKDLRQKYDSLFDEIGIGKLSLTELCNRQKELNAILRKLDPSIPKWKEYNNQLKEVNGRIKSLRDQSKSTSFSLSKLGDGFNKYATLAATTIAAFTGVTIAARQCTDEYAKMQEAQSQVRKYTGLTTEEVDDLNESLKEMDTRTARERLNGLAGDAGKLGIEGKKKILEFVDAANIINVALGEDLGEDAVKDIGKLAQMFGEDQKLGLRGAMLATGSAINEVAQKSSASEPYLAGFTARVSGAAHQARIAQADILGYASVLDQNMQNQELAATAFQNLMMKMYQEPAKFAQMAGQNVEDFTKLIKTDANQAILQFIETLSKKGGLSELAPMFAEMGLDGVRASGVISVLASKVDDIRKAQEIANKAYREGTSVVKEYNIQNSTVQAEIEKAKKAFQEIRIELGEKLLPVMKYMISTGTLTVKGLSLIVSVLIEYKSVIISVAAAVAGYTLVVKRLIIIQKAQELVTKACTVATRLFNAATKASPWGLVIAGLSAAAAFFLTYKSRTDNSAQSQKNLNKELSETEDHLNRIASIDDRSKNLSNLNSRQKEELKMDAEEEVKIIEDKLAKETIAYKKHYNAQRAEINARKGLDESQKAALLKSLDNEVDAKAKDLEKLVIRKNKLVELINKLPSSSNTVQDPGTTLPSGKEDKDKDNKAYDKRLAELETAQAKEMNALKESLFTELITQEEYQKGMYDIQVKYLGERHKAMEDFKKDTTSLDSEWLDAMIAESNRLYKEREKFTKERKIQDIPAPEEEEDPVDINSPITDYSIEKFKKTEEFKLEFLKSQRANNLISEEQYQDELTEINKKKSEERYKIIASSLMVVSDLARGVGDLMAAMQDSEISKIESKYDKQIKAARKAGKDTTKLEEKKEEEINSVKKKYADKQFAMAVLQVTSSTAVAAMEAYKSLASIPIVGPALGAAAAAAAIAAGAAQIVVAKQQRDEAKGLKSGGYSDDYIQGYTPSGNPDDVAGVIPVHKNEFVTNHEGVANPHVRQFLDIFDVAQKRGTIRLLNTTQILEQIRTRSGKYEGGYTSSSSYTASTNGSNSNITVMDRLERIINILEKVAENTGNISNKGLSVSVKEIRDGIKKLDRLEANISR